MATEKDKPAAKPKDDLPTVAYKAPDPAVAATFGSFAEQRDPKAKPPKP